MVNLRKNDVYTVTVEGYAADGMGVARLEGAVVFVKGAIRGETCCVKLIKVLKNRCYAIVEEILTPSPERIAPDCPGDRLCGGCDFRHMTYDEECRAKEQRVNDALQRVGGLSLRLSALHPAPETEHYRNKAQYFFAGDRAGFYRAGSHDIVETPVCRIQDPRSDRCRDAVKAWMLSCGVSACDERTGEGFVRYLQVRTGDGGVLVTLVAAAEKLPHTEELISALRTACPDLRGLVLNVNRKPGNVILGERDILLWGEPFVTDTLLGLTFRISSHAFYQVNRPQAEQLYAKAREYLALTGRERLVDLYCGTGTIGLTMARDAGEVLGVEIVPQAVEDAAENAQRNGIRNARFLCGDAGELAKELAEKGETADAMVVDPPRKGLSRDVIDAILSILPKKLVYISCDPATLARDLKLLTEDGVYRAEQAESYDLFPRCAHVETVCLLCKQ